MYRPNWKVAVAGGSIAALGLGGFAAAQTGGGSSPDAPDGIRLQRDASVSIHSLSSVVEVAPSTIQQRYESASTPSTPSVSVASVSVASVNDSDSLDSVPQVAPAPAPAASPTTVSPAPAPGPDDSWDSPSSPSVASFDSADSIDSSF